MNFFQRRRIILSSLNHFYLFKEKQGLKVNSYIYRPQSFTITSEYINIPANSTAQGVLLLSPTLQLNSSTNKYETNGEGLIFSKHKTLHIEYELLSTGSLKRDAIIYISRSNNVDNDSDAIGKSQYQEIGRLDTNLVGQRQELSLNCRAFGDDKILAIFNSAGYKYNIYNIWLE